MRQGGVVKTYGVVRTIETEQLYGGRIVITKIMISQHINFFLGQKCMGRLDGEYDFGPHDESCSVRWSVLHS